MKLAELGLKSKPETKYFAGGYVSFSTNNSYLFYEIHIVLQTTSFKHSEGQVRDEQRLKELLSIKSYKEVLEQ